MSKVHLPRLLGLKEICAYLGGMRREEVLARMKTGRLPKPLWGVEVTDPIARWDLRAVDRSIDAASGIPATVEAASALLDRAYGL